MIDLYLPNDLYDALAFMIAGNLPEFDDEQPMLDRRDRAVWVLAEARLWSQRVRDDLDAMDRAVVSQFEI